MDKRQLLYDLSGRIALVTGASRGSGKAVALGLASAGADVAVVSRGEAVKETASMVEQLGRRSFAMQEDLAEPDAAARIVARTVEQLGRLDILINNAGTTRRAPCERFSDEDWPLLFFNSSQQAELFGRLGLTNGTNTTIEAVHSFADNPVSPVYQVVFFLSDHFSAENTFRYTNSDVGVE